jgi:hypothetical protein
MSEFLCHYRNFPMTVSSLFLGDDTRSDKENDYVESHLLQL